MQSKWYGCIVFGMLISLVLGGRALAQQCQGYEGKRLVWMGDETLTISTAVKKFTASKLNTAQDEAVAAVFWVRTNAINWTLGGTTVTSSSGVPVNTSNGHYICGKDNLKAWQAIRSGSSDATVYVIYSAVH